MPERNSSILFVSNGHGEDLIAARIIKSLIEQEPSLRLQALPIVGRGAAYREMGIPLSLEGKTMPSGGFIRNGPANLWMDLKAGLWGLTGSQIKALRSVRERVDLAVCVGDVVLLILAGCFLRRPILFLPTAKSDYVAPHWAVERFLMKRFCRKILTRDAKTAASLSRYGLPAEFLGNVMMDALDYQGQDLKGSPGEWVIAVLPGSRLEAYDNLEDIARVALAFQPLVPAEKKVRYLVALSGGLALTELANRLEVMGWRGVNPEPEERLRGVVGHLEYKQPPIRMTVLQGRFADILAACDGVLGMAGTANEQAVGLGKPVVTFVGRGPQFTAKFLRTQKRLLGDSISVTDREPSASALELARILNDPARREAMARIGRERMGPTGGAARIAAAIRSQTRDIILETAK
ncbi:MAG TPA: lipid-A-disaccharide synthase-related protein [Bacillota bacterium]